MRLHHRLSSLLVAVVLCCANVGASEPEVRTPAGTFRGKVLTSHSGHQYESYRGIPYALPPTGHRRFALPVRHPVIEGAYNATEFGSQCLQRKDGTAIGQEDCLFLNVYTPVSGKETNGRELKKVLVYVHGGGLVMGASDWYLPGDLVTRGDFVVLTMNYRLHWLGFLRGNSSSLPGNVGLWDQVLALQWVKDNIQAFGGDPSDVTLSGESAGSISASILSVSPLGKGLFTKVLLMSGTAAIAPNPPRTTNDLLQAAANRFGCDVGSVNGNEETIVNCLKKLPGDIFANTFDEDFIFQCVSSDDELLPKPFRQLLGNTSYLSDVGFLNRNYIVSITSDDGYIFVNSRFGIVDTTSVNKSAEGVYRTLSLPRNVAAEIITEYTKLYGDIDKAVTALLRDFVFLNHSVHFLESYSRPPKQHQVDAGKNAYLMSFDNIPKYVPNKYMLHSLDLAYLFDLDIKGLMESYYYIEIVDGFHEEDVALKADFIDLVTDFMKTGNPSQKLTQKKKNIVWPPYDPERKSYLSFSLQPSVGQDIFSDRSFIWETLVPQWLQEDQRSE
ncbi:unnamed protein product [Candidula unifasciata]|uniref:Carboxylic ester hydrolase n=1 Tax=Candidula unifasciata TaxID=100452 RepID=A0A8S3ZLQ7_9EUPU|nr:unnamed protein product [Candidula unifasciata]